MREAFTDKIVSSLSNHFELFMYVNGCVAALVLAVVIALKLRDVSVLDLVYSTMKRVLYIVIVTGQIILFAVFGYLYWKNYHRPAPELYLARDVRATTSWVSDDIRIYFIDGNALRSVKVNGQDGEVVLQADAPVREYHFSPDGGYLLVMTEKDLFLVDEKTKTNRRIDTLRETSGLKDAGGGEETKGSIGGIQWAPDSRKFVYEVARWSKFATQDTVYIYTLGDQTKKTVISPTRRISSVYWGQQGEDLYYLRHEAQDTSRHPSTYEVRVFRIPLDTLTPEMVTRIPFEKASPPIENLDLRGIALFLEGAKFSFGRSGREDHLISENGSSVGIDKDDYFYFISKKWFRKRLFKIPRERRITQLQRYQYKGGDLVVDHIRWIPGGRYVIMEHRYWGVLILEPSTGKVGLLIQAKGHAFGWYHGIKV